MEVSFTIFELFDLKGGKLAESHITAITKIAQLENLLDHFFPIAAYKDRKSQKSRVTHMQNKYGNPHLKNA